MKLPVAALDSWGTNNGTYYGNEIFGLSGALGGDANTSVDFAGDGYLLVKPPFNSDFNGGLDPNGSWTVECWVRPDLDAATEGGLFAVPVASVDLTQNRSGYLFLNNPTGGNSVWATAVVISLVGMGLLEVSGL